MSQDNPYSRMEQWLHRLALGSDSRLELAFDLEKQFFGRRLSVDSGNPVFVCGLARAGTTLLMRLLFETGQFCSLTYRDMPFVLSPNLWSRLSGLGKKQADLQERAHGDGLLVGFDSPEALEEVFWRVFCGPDYIHPDHLSPMTASDQVVDDFRTYLQLILFRYGGVRYLSKNNNNTLRVPTILKAFPQAQILVPFRHPIAQAQSLLEQHLQFSAKQGREPFVLRYMDWLVHCDFGLGHRPCVFGDGPSPYNRTDLQYWLALWTETYSWLLDQYGRDGRVHFLCYEQLCADPAGYWRKLGESLDLVAELPAGLPVRPLGQRKTPAVSPSLVAEADAVYQSLLDRSC